MLFVLIGKIVNEFLMPLLAQIPNAEAITFQVPYGMNVLIPAYITYIEPTIASFVVFYLIKDRLLGLSTLTKGFILGGIIITLHAGIYSILQIIYSEGNIFYRTFYYGQFLWEYLALGFLTVYSFAFFQKPLSEFSINQTLNLDS